MGWVVALLLVGAGRARKNSRLVSWGVVAVGIMTVITPLGLYLAQTILVNGGVFEATPLDFLLLASFSSLGGGIITLGFVRLAKKTG